MFLLFTWLFFFSDLRVFAVDWIPKIPVTVLTEREVHARAHLSRNAVTDRNTYEFEAIFRTNANREDLNRVIRDYQGLQNWVPYLERSLYHKEVQTLSIRGGLWGWVLESLLKLKEVSMDLLEFEIIAGHLKGLKGQVEYAPVKSHPLGQKLVQGQGLFVKISGKREGGEYPPKFIMERGAELALTLGGKRVRTEAENRAESAVVHRVSSSGGSHAVGGRQHAEQPKPTGEAKLMEPSLQRTNTKGTQDESEYPKPQNHF